MKLNYATLVALAIALVLIVLRFGHIPWTPMRITGAAIAAPSLLLLVIARMQLGIAFSVSAKAEILVTSGLYSRIRNPIYVFGGLFLVGLALVAEKPWLLLALLVLVPMQVFRSRNEERVLQQKFGAEYDRYKAETWF